MQGFIRSSATRAISVRLGRESEITSWHAGVGTTPWGVTLLTPVRTTPSQAGFRTAGRACTLAAAGAILVRVSTSER